MTVKPASFARAVAVVDAVRTPIGKFLGSFSELTAADLGVIAVEALFARTGIAAGAVDELLFGNGRQAGGGPNVARQISVRSGIPVDRPAWTVNMACGSGLKAITLGAESIALGRSDVVVCGGTESMTRLPFFLPRMREGYRLGHAQVVDGMYQDGFQCPLANMVMGATAEKLAQEMGISRVEQDEFALASQQKSQAAREAGRFDDELCPVPVPQRKGNPLVISQDEHPRNGATLASLAQLPPVFDREKGTVTAGNASGITDGASALLLVAADKLDELELTPLAWVGEYAESGVDPRVMGLGPVPTLKKLARKNQKRATDYDLVELNEAFAAQVLACQRELPLPIERLNVNGGAISLGHPIGATGARIATTLLHELRRRNGEHGLATLCISGGMGLAVAFHRTGL